MSNTVQNELVRPEVQGFSSGYHATMDIVAGIVRDLHAAGNVEASCEIHDLVWRVLRDRQDAMVEAEKTRWREAEAEAKAITAAFLANAPRGSAHGLRTELA